MEKIKILIVEDTGEIARKIVEYLGQKKFKVVDIVETEEKAVLSARKHTPDLVLMNIVLREGLEQEYSTSDSYWASIVPVIYFTTHKNIIYLERTLFSHYSFIPADSLTLESTVRNALSLFTTEKNNVPDEKKYGSLFNHMPDAFLYLKLLYDENKQVFDALCLEANQAFLRLVRKERHELTNHRITEIFPDIDHRKENWKEILFQIETRKKSKANQIHITSTDQWYYVYGYCPAEHYVAIMIHDITAELRAEQAIKESEEKYRSLYEYSNDAIMIFSNTSFIDCNRAALRMFGYEREEFLAKTPFDLSSSDQLDLGSVLRVGARIRQAFEAGEERFEWHFQRKSKETFTADVLLSSFLEKGDTFYQATIRDISEKKDHEVMLRNNIAFFTELIEKIPIPVFYTNRQGEYEGCNSYFARKILGFPKEEIIGRTLADFPQVCAPHLLHIYKEYDSSLTNEKTFSYETEITCANKMSRNFIIYKALYVNPYNGEEGIVGVMIDITKRKKIEQVLLEKEERYKNLFSSIDSLLIGTSLRDIITNWNSTAEKIFGLSAADVVGRPIIGLRISWEWDKIYIGISECISNMTQVSLSDISYTSIDGKQGLLGIKINPIIDMKDILKGFLIFGQDVTEKRIMESQLLQDQKLKSIGELAAGIAHEINTPTQYISDNTYFLKDAFADLAVLCAKVETLLDRYAGKQPLDDLVAEIKAYMKEKDLDYLHEEIPKAIDQSLEGLQRVSGIIKSMKSFSHPGQEKKIYLDINKALSDTITISRNEWKYIAEIKTDFDPGDPEVLVMPAEINQVFLNIIVNAAHAIQSAIRKKQIEHGVITIQSRLNETYLEVSIKDNGVGIPDAIKGRIFDHFFTTKEVGKGTGQGLALAHTIIVEKHKGKILVNSREGEGTIFTIQLPLFPDSISGEYYEF